MADQPPIRSCRLRFSLRTLLAMPALFAIGWWWITWPERTARRFVELLSAGNVPAAQTMFDGPSLYFEYRSIEARPRSPHLRLRLQTAGWAPALLGQRKFMAEVSPGREFHFEAARGRIRIDQLTRTYYVKRVSAEKLAQLLILIYAQREDLLIVASEKKKKIVVTVPEDDLTPEDYTIHTGLGRQAVSAKEMQQNLGKLIAMMDQPNSGMDELSAKDLTIIRRGRRVLPLSE